MKILTLDKSIFRAFEGLDPLEIHKMKEYDADLMLGAVISGDGKDVPAGLLLGKADDSEMILRWLFVDPDYRRIGCAEQLLSQAFNIAEERGLKGITVHFPEIYGYTSICRNDRSFFLSHGFAEKEDGGMVSDISDYQHATEYEEPTDLDDDEMRDMLLSMEEDDEEETAEEWDSCFSEIHKPWEVQRVGLRDFSKKDSVQNFVKTALAGKEVPVSGNIGELTFAQFKEGIELCEKNGHTGFLNSLFETPADYFDMDVSSYTMEDGQVSGMCLVHYSEKEKSLSVELIFTSDTDNLRGLAELNRVSLLAANKKYDPDTTLILPYDEKLHKPLINKLFGE